MHMLVKLSPHSVRPLPVASSPSQILMFHMFVSILFRVLLIAELSQLVCTWDPKSLLIGTKAMDK